MIRPLLEDPRFHWMDGNNIRPYVLKRKVCEIPQPGQGCLDWFPFKPLEKDPQKLDESDFTDQILNLENMVFSQKNLAMPRWVFYDCAIMPGITVGFVLHKSLASESILKVVRPQSTSEWIPLSLFIIIPTMVPGEWVAHNLSSINSALPEKERYYGLGFLSKAFGLWYSNIEVCCGVTQWSSPAIKLHSRYGDMEILTAYTPAHSYAQTLTYRLKVNQSEWHSFYSRQASERFRALYQPSGWCVDRAQPESLIHLQRRLEQAEGPFFLNPAEIDSRPLDSALTLYSLRRN